jgi:murein DD-endopeptidase MepM/ murein hydrolase activator NlpD
MNAPRRSWAAALLLGGGLLLAGRELPFINWRPIVAPLEDRPLVLRQDAMGDGRFLAPRSGGRQHRGIDLAAPLSSPVRAIRSGRIVAAGTHRGLGRFVEIRHSGRLYSLYAHLKDVHVARGERVEQGTVIGTVGKTGNARHAWIMPHVHFEVLRDGQPIDPQTLGLEVLLPSAHASGEPADAEEEHVGGDG